MNTQRPNQGFIFWPVGNGDSTTVVIGADVTFQVDLNHLDSADEDGDPHAPVIDELIALLPKVSGKPYLSAFGLTHPDQDHCRGFARLLKKVHIGELWFTPRVFREYKNDLSDDAVAFKKEAERRLKKTIQIGGAAGAGDRVRIVGSDDLLQEEEFAGFPKELLTVPGNAVTMLDGVERGTQFRAFVHAPFKDDAAGERNEASLGLQVRLIGNGKVGQALLLGDLSYPTVKRIFDVSAAEDLVWNVFLAPHHCSKSVMYWQDEGVEEETLKQDILDAIENHAGTPGHIVASCEPVPALNKPGDNPPHAKAKARYEGLAPDGFMCTQEHPSKTNPKPIVFAMGTQGLTYVRLASAAHTGAAAKTALATAVERGRGGTEAPKDRVGFGEWR